MKKKLKEFYSDIREPLEKGDYDSALKVLREAIKIYPEEPSLIVNIGNIFKHKGSTRQAENYYKKALEIKNLKKHIIILLFYI